VAMTLAPAESVRKVARPSRAPLTENSAARASLALFLSTVNSRP
jgi:hypothetical protein